MKIKTLRSKYGNEYTAIDNIVFASKKEAKRYQELILLQRGRKIWNLAVHPRFELQGKFVDNMGNKQRAITYEADFAYYEMDKNNNVKEKVIEDVKGYLTDTYKLKKRLFLYKYKDVIFREIM